MRCFVHNLSLSLSLSLAHCVSIVVTPEHCTHQHVYTASNGFFLQFPNCLAYETLPECVDKIKFALKNDPKPLSPELAYKFTWEGAKERLFEASVITKREMLERSRSGAEEADKQVAWWHVQGAKRGQFITSLVSPRKHPAELPTEMNNGKKNDGHDNTPSATPSKQEE